MILYSAECATQVALDGIQCFGEWPPLLAPSHRKFLSTPHSALQLTAATLAPLGSFFPSY